MRQSLFLLRHKQGSACLLYTPEPLRLGCFLISAAATGLKTQTLGIAGKTCSCEVWRLLRPASAHPVLLGVCKGCGLLLGLGPVPSCRGVVAGWA